MPYFLWRCYSDKITETVKKELTSSSFEFITRMYNFIKNAKTFLEKRQHT